LGEATFIKLDFIWVAHVQVDEVNDAVTWVIEHAEHFGGDPQRVHLLGHSAGAHLCMMALLQRAQYLRRTAKHTSCTHSDELGSNFIGLPVENKIEEPTFAACMPRGALLMAGVYNICRHFEYEAKRGVETLSTMQRAMGGEKEMLAVSPCSLVAHAVVKAREPVAESSDGSHGAGGEVLHGLGYYASFPFSGQGIAERVLGSCNESHDVESLQKTRAFGAMPENGRDSVDGCGGSYWEQQRHDVQLKGRCAADGNVTRQTAEVAGTPDPRSVLPLAGDLEVVDLKQLPPIVLMHGTTDLTVPWYESVEMARSLKDAGVNARLLLYDWVPHAAFSTAWSTGKLADARSFQQDIVQLVFDNV
jgi:pimeloyl-ACP methyl ester carboxylesterase